MRTFPRSLGYAAPELLDKKPYGFSVDIFAAGATFFFALSARLPFAAQDMTPESVSVRMKKGVISFDERFHHVSDGTQGAIRMFMHGNPSWRPTASAALSSAPFGPAVDVEELPNAASDDPHRLAPDLKVRAPSQARERPARPAPHARTRQDASSSPPFGPSVDAEREEVLVNASLDEPLSLAPVLEVRAPPQARERQARPAPRARMRQDANQGTSQASAASAAQAP
eukprot:TRINITY_DN24442_c0_g2_i1.p1 TRINITY_DN24442_c0_g2~~TRINITY_DN24442_c0_g2_i1.p1  ORF type:complete len:227 (+),score=25.88 TRINITY_DN24442_c0_g2_i1:2-682(+)